MMDNILDTLDHEQFVKLLAAKHSLGDIKSFLSVCSSHVASEIVKESKARTNEDILGLGDRFYKFEQAQLLEPRGRFDISVKVGGILLEGKAGNFVLAWGSISQVNIVPACASSKKVYVL